MYTGSLTQQDKEIILSNGLTVEEVEAQWVLFPDQNLDTVIGSVQMLKKGEGQERNMPFTDENGNPT